MTKKYDPFDPKSAGIRSEGAKSKSGLGAIDSRNPEAIDQYVEINHKIKDLEGEFSRLRGVVAGEGLEVYGDRAMTGDIKNFKLQGNQSYISHITIDKSSAIDSAAYSMLIETYGDAVVHRVIEPDLSSVRFNIDLLMKHRAQIVELLSPLGPDVMAELFTKPLYKTKKGIQQLMVDEAKGLAKGKTGKRYSEAAAKEAADAKQAGLPVRPRRPEEVAFTHLLQDFKVQIQLRSQSRGKDEE